MGKDEELKSKTPDFQFLKAFQQELQSRIDELYLLEKRADSRGQQIQEGCVKLLEAVNATMKTTNEAHCAAREYVYKVGEAAQKIDAHLASSEWRLIFALKLLMGSVLNHSLWPS